MPYEITQCYLPPGRGDFPAFTPAKAGTQFSDPRGMQGWVDLSWPLLSLFRRSKNNSNNSINKYHVKDSRSVTSGLVSMPVVKKFVSFLIFEALITFHGLFSLSPYMTQVSRHTSCFFPSSNLPGIHRESLQRRLKQGSREIIIIIIIIIRRRRRRRKFIKCTYSWIMNQRCGQSPGGRMEYVNC